MLKHNSHKKTASTFPCPSGSSSDSKSKISLLPDSHCCAEILAGIPAGLPQFTERLQENLVLCPAVPAPKGTVAVRAAGPLDIIYDL